MPKNHSLDQSTHAETSTGSSAKDGQRFYESSESCKFGDAQRLLAPRRAEVYSGSHLDNRSQHLIVNSLLDDLERDYRINNKDHEWAVRVLRKRLRPYFGSLHAVKFKYETAQCYIDKRQTSGAANVTINRELALLHCAFTLGKESLSSRRFPKSSKKQCPQGIL